MCVCASCVTLTNGFPEGRYTRSTSGSNSTRLSGLTRTPFKSLKFAP